MAPLINSSPWSGTAKTAAAGDVCIIIPQRNAVEQTIACLRSLQRFEAPEIEVLVVDDGSEPGALRTLQRSRFPGVSVLCQPQLGTTAAWNHGWQATTRPLVIFLNNDVETTGPWVRSLVAPLRAASGTVQMVGVDWRKEPAFPPSRPRRMLVGWCFALRRTTLQELGGFERALRLYYSDTALQYRLLLQSQLLDQRHPTGADPRVVVPRLALRHVGQASTGLLPDRRQRWEQDRQRFLQWLATIDLKTGDQPGSSRPRDPLCGRHGS